MSEIRWGLRSRIGRALEHGSGALAAVAQYLAHIFETGLGTENLGVAAAELSNGLARLHGQRQHSAEGLADDQAFVEGGLAALLELVSALRANPLIHVQATALQFEALGVREKVLALLHAGENRPTKIAELAEVQISQVSRAVAELLSAGLVEPVDNFEFLDGRARWYRLTGPGEQVMLAMDSGSILATSR